MQAKRILTTRELNRATLARQLLLERVEMGPLAAVEQLAGLQGQLANPPYMGLWSRLKAFQRADLTALLERREVVRTSLMRRTLHLTSVTDYLHFRPALRPLHARNLRAYAESQETGLDQESLLSGVLAYLREKPRTNVELRARLEELLPGQGEQLLYRVRIQLPLIQVFPGGVWGIAGSPAYAEATDWLGRSFAEEEAGLNHLILRYLAAFGPASVRDIQAWSGLTRLQPALDALRPVLTTFQDEQGRELFDLPGAPLPAAETPAPVRFLPDFDNLLLAHDDRRRIIADAHRAAIFPGNSRVLPVFLLDGFASGTWLIERIPTGARLLIQPFEPLTEQQSQAVHAEGQRLLHWVADRPGEREITFTASPGKAGKQNMWGKL